MEDLSKYKYYKGEDENPWGKYRGQDFDGWHERLFCLFWILEHIHATKGDEEFKKYKKRIFSKWINSKERNGTYYYVEDYNFRYDNNHFFTDISYINLNESLERGDIVYADKFRMQSPLYAFDDERDDLGDIKYMRLQTIPESVQEIYRKKQMEATSK